MAGSLLVTLAALGSGLVAGVFFAFSTFVMKALGRLPPAEGISAMQSINVVVINPWFMVPFLGTAAAGVALAAWALLRWGEPGAAFMLAGGVLYVAGTFGVTIALNVPWNDALAAVQPASAEGARVWAAYLERWTLWNHLRTACALAAAACLLRAL
ncbi:DUF1772 domain-containing protein [Arenibaculum sp.]|jgi:uncharacterized membrane protein|uniref:anthrone oxygenase family protein n=1 Tax=Arenibaculum sp. TaxID=2865862 RepID=UPI002E11B24B|nr:anthrone oxygenase family protein [Arenibaculum sp.]